MAFYLVGEITQVLESIPWVRCASGNVLDAQSISNSLGLWKEGVGGKCLVFDVWCPVKTKKDSKLKSPIFDAGTSLFKHSLLIDWHCFYMETSSRRRLKHPSVKSFQLFLVRRRWIEKISRMDFPRFEFFSDINRGCIPLLWEQGPT